MLVTATATATARRPVRLAVRVLRDPLSRSLSSNPHGDLDPRSLGSKAMRTKLLAAEHRAVSASDPHALVDADPIGEPPRAPAPGATTFGGSLKEAFVWGVGMTIGMVAVRALFGF